MKTKLLSRLGGPSALALAAAFLPPHSAMAQDAGTPETTSQAEPAAATGIPAWGITDAELQADPTVTYGVLENGMRYAIKRNTQPAGEASMRLLFDVGMRDDRSAIRGRPLANQKRPAGLLHAFETEETVISPRLQA